MSYTKYQQCRLKASEVNSTVQSERLHPQFQDLIHQARNSIDSHILRLPAVKHKTGRCNASVYADVAMGILPKPLSIGPRAVGWISAELQACLDARVLSARSGVELDMKLFVSILTAPKHQDGN